ncbi:DoxX family protein [Mycolicibacter sp. MYC123]|uniref:DoxX family protein n=1 Tax=[Mycobacterium] zoologicum TaxID=2872311 RepID=A0ABU5YMD8_9MYCO|nr:MULTISPECIES: DoxX family protein [Mycobacteriaceae]MEB3049883.1 DoxX family protein [Mycolicibacter sp. MYC123]MEB3062262.1 DoxX family protein [Mycolicibacter sp. MYC101]
MRNIVIRGVSVAAGFRPAYGRVADALSDLGWLANLVLRLTIGFMFFSGAIGKLGDLTSFTKMFADLGIPAPAFLAAVTAVVELVGGAALMLGLGTRVVSLVLAGDMVGALITDIGPGLAQKYPGWWDFLSNLFYAPEWLLVGLLAWLVCVGSGKAGLDGLLARRTPGNAA